MGGLRGQHQLRRRGGRRQGPPRRAVHRRGTRRARRLGPRREHRPLQPDRGRRRQPGARVRHRPGRGRAALPRAPSRGQDRHPAARHGRRQPEPGLGWAQPRAPLAARARRRRCRPRAGPRPPPRDLRATCRCRCCSTCSPTSRRGRSSSSCRATTRWSAACSRRARTSSTDYTLDGFRAAAGDRLRGRRARSRSRRAHGRSSCCAAAERDGRGSGRALGRLGSLSVMSISSYGRFQPPDVRTMSGSSRSVEAEVAVEQHRERVDRGRSSAQPQVLARRRARTTRS